MFKQSVRTLSIIAALFSIHTAASATCTGTDCQVDVSGSFDFTLGENTDGIYVQKNVGTNTAIVDLKRVVMRDGGDIAASATAIGNNISINVSEGSTVPVRHVSQSNYGDQTASVKLWQSHKSVTGEVTLESISIGNNFSVTLDNTSLSELSVAQCNVSDNVALTSFVWDPTKLTANATAIGNNISIGGVRP
ncbi:MAG: hypothetical protein RLO04_14075 [Limnobacter sp.]|uniref:hypothetical protein n=1 Tax=Limnobacter sp. TaxID=2003368 RepID=UPI0032ED7F22